MRRPFPPLPSTVRDRGGEELLHCRIHELVRDYPELLPFFGTLSGSLAVAGNRRLGDTGAAGGEAWDTLVALTAWRSSTPG